MLTAHRAHPSQGASPRRLYSHAKVCQRRRLVDDVKAWPNRTGAVSGLSEAKNAERILKRIIWYFQPLAVAALAFGCSTQAPAEVTATSAESDEIPLRILAINDFHDHVAAHLRSLSRRTNHRSHEPYGAGLQWRGQPRV